MQKITTSLFLLACLPFCPASGCSKRTLSESNSTDQFGNLGLNNSSGNNKMLLPNKRQKFNAIPSTNSRFSTTTAHIDLAQESNENNLNNNSFSIDCSSSNSPKIGIEDNPSTPIFNSNIFLTNNKDISNNDNLTNATSFMADLPFYFPFPFPSPSQGIFIPPDISGELNNKDIDMWDYLQNINTLPKNYDINNNIGFNNAFPNFSGINMFDFSAFNLPFSPLFPPPIIFQDGTIFNPPNPYSPLFLPLDFGNTPDISNYFQDNILQIRGSQHTHNNNNTFYDKEDIEIDMGNQNSINFDNGSDFSLNMPIAHNTISEYIPSKLESTNNKDISNNNNNQTQIPFKKKRRKSKSSKTSSSTTRLNRPKKIKKKVSGLIKCKGCNLLYQSNRTLVEHLKLKHATTIYKEYLVSKKKKRAKNTFSCEKCPLKYSTKGSLVKDRSKVHLGLRNEYRAKKATKKVFYCAICNKNYQGKQASPSFRKKHLEHHLIEQKRRDANKWFPCQWCKKTSKKAYYGTKRDLKCHYRRQHRKDYEI